jgi:hypothetical protein
VAACEIDRTNEQTLCEFTLRKETAGTLSWVRDRARDSEHTHFGAATASEVDFLEFCVMHLIDLQRLPLQGLEVSPVQQPKSLF